MKVDLHAIITVFIAYWAARVALFTLANVASLGVPYLVGAIFLSGALASTVMERIAHRVNEAA